MNTNGLKKSAAIEAVKNVQSNQILGLGTGSTVFFVLEELSKKIKSGELKNIKGISSSNHTSELAVKFGITLSSLDENPSIDLNIDGADEVDKELNLIKGGGGALLKEKIIAQASKKNIFVVDETKVSNILGEKFFLPVEVIPFSTNSVIEFLKKMNLNPKPRIVDGNYFVTDQKNIIIDLYCGEIPNPKKLSSILNEQAGIVEHGLFIGLTDILIVGRRTGVETIHGLKF